MDRAVGELLDLLRSDGALGDTLVVVVGDHGEGRGDHGEEEHGVLVYDTTVHVPFLMRYPDGYRAGERSGEIVSIADVFPTIVEALALGPPGDVDGVSLWRRGVSADRGVYFESYMGYLSFGWSPLAGWRDREGKYLHSSDPQFFAVREDPQEMRNLVQQDGIDLERYRRGIAAVADAPALEPSATPSIGEDMLRDLRALGYAALGGAPPEVPHPLAPSDRPSPAKMILQYTFLLRATGLIDAGRTDEAIKILERAAKTSPENYFALEQLCAALVREKRMKDALPYLERLTRDGPARSVNFQNLAASLGSLGRNEEAIDALERAIALDPKNADAIEGLIKMLLRVGRSGETEPLRDRLRALKRRP